MNLKALLREPLLHFSLIGLALFLVYGQAATGDDGGREIVVSQAQVDDMVRQFVASASRPPTRAELDGLVATWVRDEIAYREGRALGLDQDDPVIKRRVRQKYDLIAEEQNRRDPTEADLAAFLDANRARFARPAVVSFDQILFDPASNSPEAVDAARVALAKGADPARFGQPSMLPRRVADSAIDLVARDFGDRFAAAVGTAPPGRWVGPIASDFGVHLIRVTRRAAPVLPPLDQVRAAVLREYESDQRSRALDATYRAARADYDVTIKARLP